MTPPLSANMAHGIGEREALLALAKRVETLGCDLTCPLCGEDGFDVPGISMHWFRWCEVEKAIGTSRDNAEAAAALRARALPAA